MEHLHKVGPVALLVAQDPTLAAGAGWTFIGGTRGQTVWNPNPQKSYGQTDQTGSTKRAGATYLTGWDPGLTCQLLDETKTVLKAYAANMFVLSGGGGAIGLASGLQKIQEPWLVAVPTDELAAGINSENAIWMPAADVAEFGSITRGLPDNESESPRQTVFKGLLRTTVKAGGAVLPQGAQIGFIGSPVEWGIAGIVLPDLTQLGIPTQVGA